MTKQKEKDWSYLGGPVDSDWKNRPTHDPAIPQGIWTPPSDGLPPLDPSFFHLEGQGFGDDNYYYIRNRIRRIKRPLKGVW